MLNSPRSLCPRRQQLRRQRSPALASPRAGCREHHALRSCGKLSWLGGQLVHRQRLRRTPRGLVAAAGGRPGSHGSRRAVLLCRKRRPWRRLRRRHPARGLRCRGCCRCLPESFVQRVISVLTSRRAGCLSSCKTRQAPHEHTSRGAVQCAQDTCTLLAETGWPASGFVTATCRRIRAGIPDRPAGQDHTTRHGAAAYREQYEGQPVTAGLPTLPATVLRSGMRLAVCLAVYRCVPTSACIPPSQVLRLGSPCSD